MYKQELVKRVARRTRLTQEIVGDVVNETLKLIVSTLAEGGKVQIPGFGAFATRYRAEGKGSNIKTGQTMTVPARWIPAFRAGELLKQAARRNKSATPKELEPAHQEVKVQPKEEPKAKEAETAKKK